MNQTQPETPESDSLPDQNPAPVKQATTLDDVLTALASIQSDQREILNFLKALSPDATPEEPQNKTRAQKLKEAVERGDFDGFSV